MSGELICGMRPSCEETFASMEAAKAFIAEYVRRFDPYAYGTLCQTFPHPDGSVTVRCLRGDSCE